MKKLLCLILALAMITSFATMFTVVAEEGAEEPKFVVDAQLDEFYRDDAWAVANNCYFYFNSIDDTTLPVISRDFNIGMGELDLPEFFEKVKVKIYAAYDDQYAYFYVDVDDPNIIDHVINDDGTRNEYHQQMENIDFYIDTDVMSCSGHFNTNEPSDVDADTHFRLMAHNLAVTDTQGHNNKYIFADQPLKDPEGNKSADNYFKCSDNMVARHKTDASGKLTGYVCETRVPLAHNYEGYEHYTSFYYNIAVTNSKTDMDELPCAIATGYRWWLAYDTGKTVVYDPAAANPFFYPVDENQTAADIVTTLINQLTDPDEIEEWEAYDVQEKIDAYEALTDEQKPLVKPEAYDKLVACAAAVGINWPEEPEPGPGPTPGPQVTYGDVDGNGKVEATDALEVLKNVVGKVKFTDEQLLAADVNGDKKADAADALMILQKVVGKIDKFPVEA